MSSILENADIKSKCQIFTPHSVVVDMLNEVGYTRNLLGKRILENSCGNGRFLVEIVQRYIFDAQSQGLTTTAIKAGLETDIWGAELDKEQYTACIAALEEVAYKNGIANVNWNIHNCDSLRKPFQQTFDFIVGNPPYLSYWDLPESERVYVRENYTTCDNGAFDYCFAFIEKAVTQLSNVGKLAYIIPGSIFKTRTAKSLRQFIKPLLTNIIEYKAQTVFTDATTSPSIIVLEAGYLGSTINYYDVPTQKSVSITKAELNDELWVFEKAPINDQQPAKKRFGDFFEVSSSVATQYNNAYILTGWTTEGDFLVSKDRTATVELTATRPAARPKRQATSTLEYIIFPYRYENGKLVRYAENEYRKQFPLAYDYLIKSKEKLGERAADKKAAWYEYGRSQALQKLNQEKILLCPVVSNVVQAWKIGEDVVPYSGFFIVAKEGSNIDDALDIIKRSAFTEYIKTVGINANGSSVRFSTRNVENYTW